jgi:hypothetical protein
MKKTRELAEDVSLILYVIPFILSGVASLIFWQDYQGSLGFPPHQVYLLVTKNPVLFIGGLASICLAALIEAWGKSEETLNSISAKLRIVSYISLFFAFLFALTSNPNPSLSSAIANLLEGKFALLFPLFLILLSYLLLPLNLSPVKENYMQIITLLLLFLSPLSLYALWSLRFAWPITIGISGALLITACIVYYISSKG